MFGKRKQTGTLATAKGPAGPRSEPDLTAPRAKSATPARTATPVEPPRRPPGQAQGQAQGQSQGQSQGQGLAAAPAQRPDPEVYGDEVAAEPLPAPASGTPNEGRRLVVGRDIRLSGEIKKCDKLVVEGQVEASLTESRALEISETGLFSGDAVVEEAEVSGCFEGELTVNGRLHIRASGQVVGTVRYADIEIERGGRIAGSIDVMLPPTSDDMTRPTMPPVRSNPGDGNSADSDPIEAGSDGDEDEVLAQDVVEDIVSDEVETEDVTEETPERASETKAAKTDGPANGASKPLPLMERNRPDARS